ncbi:MAG: cyclopropane-fatty-acyl-phospholipid synthase family protein [Rhodospirillaceae bacterium]|jgi:cyclopropane-fatty-acyl-phospholipid synthase
MLLSKLLVRLIQRGTLNVIDAFGEIHVFGQGEPTVTIQLNDRSLHWKLFVNPLLYAGEAYMDESLTVVEGSLYDFIALVGMNRVHTNPHPVSRLTALGYRLLKRLHQWNTARRAQRNVSHHYDLSREFYDLFLDPKRQYSCAYYPNGDEDLETAQMKKIQLIASKLLIKPGHNVLDIGSGWGGLSLYLAKKFDCNVTGLTLSKEQFDYAIPRARNAGLAEKTHYHLRDYRQQTGHFDRIVSIGMFEHVGVNHYGEYFAKVSDLLTDHGVALVHTIGRSDGPGITNRWIQKYIFPGGYIPALSEIVQAIEKSGLIITDLEVLRIHYAKTLRHWRESFMANWGQAATLYDKRFCRMWEFYLAASEASFHYMDNVVFQIQMAKRHDAVPLARDYIIDRQRESNREYRTRSGSQAA